VNGGVFDNGVTPLTELEAVSLTWYYCSICDDCQRERKVRDTVDAEWREVSVLEFCAFRLSPLSSRF
jgi:hypothetical protein